MKRKNRCGDCDGCLAANCGSCPHCRDMIKFGGPGKMKQACVNRVCVTRSLGEAGAKTKRAQDIKGRKRNDQTNYSRGSHGCDQCERQFHHKNDLEAHLLTHSIQNRLKYTGDANSPEEKVKIEKNECNNSEGEIEIIGEMCSNHNLMAQSEKMSINNNDLGVTNKSKLEDKLGIDNDNYPVVSILTEKADDRISEKKFYKTEGISLSDVEILPRGMKSESAVQMIDRGVGFNEVKNSVISQRVDEKKSEDIIKKNETEEQFDDVIVISDDDTDLTSNLLDRQYEIRSSENYSGRIDEYFKKGEVLMETVEGLKDEDDKAGSEVNANKGGNSSQLIRKHEPREKNIKGYLMSENSLEISNAAKISQQSLNKEQTNCNGPSKTSVITKKPSFETTEKKVTSVNIGKDDIINSEKIIRKNKTSIESTGITVFVDEDMDKIDQLKEESCESYFSPIRTNYCKDVKEIAAQELVQDEMAELEKVLTIKKQDNAVPSKQSTNNENISNKSIFEVNVNLRIPAATFLNSPEKHCEGELRKNKIIETDNGYMSEEIGEMSEFSTTSDEDDSSDQSEELINKSVEEEHFDRHSKLNLSVPIPSFNHPLLSFSRSQAGPTPSTKLSHTAGNVIEDTQTRCPRFQDYWDNEFEDMTTSDFFFESLPIEDRSIEDIYEDFIKRKSIYIN